MTSDAARSSVNKYRGLIGQIDVAAEQYSSAPPAIDFKAFKEKIRAVKDVDGGAVSVVDILESVSKNFKPNTSATGSKSDLEAAVKSAEAALKSASGSDKAVASLTLDVLKATLVSFDSSAADAAAKAESEDAATLTAEAANAKKTAADAKKETTARIAELEATVNRMKSKRVGKDTTVDDIYEAYPEIKVEVHDEINTHQWHKDIA
ncbi:hypothetical protein TL16_g04847 [Triparma laevis f. inornata]|uniref:ATP synthase subunit d, mitochondrial n=1 Tax=Triparma laevis f. inornata TaxID=1714386 RepID=A0A9W7A9P3_9STRA|nr:hypothetical protein TL16_g04847 [Triparma laevis f. inornata]